MSLLECGFKPCITHVIVTIILVLTVLIILGLIVYEKSVELGRLQSPRLLARLQTN